jgi:hypothetical protein
MCREHLTDDGALGIWLQGYSTSVDDFRMVLRTLFSTFDDVSLWTLYYGDFMLIARPNQTAPSLDAYLRSYSDPSVREDLYRIGLHRPAHLLGRYVASGSKLREWVETAEINTDDNARLEFSAPRTLYIGRVGLSEAIFTLQEPVIDALFQGAPGTKRPAGLDDEIANVVAARWTPVRVNQLLAEGKVDKALRFLLEAYRADPTNTVYGSLTSMRDQLLGTPSAWTDKPEISLLVERLKQVKPPIALPKRTGEYAEVGKSLRVWARQAADVGLWDSAADHLSEARESAPDDTDLSLELIEALVHSGRTEQAAALLSDPAMEGVDADRIGALRLMIQKAQNEGKGSAPATP